MAIYVNGVKVAGNGSGNGVIAVGVPPGGAAGQFLAKRTEGDYDIHWVDPPEAGESGGGTAGVSSFKGRTGAVTPQAGDYTAAMVGAVTETQMTAAIQAAVLDSWEGSY